MKLPDHVEKIVGHSSHFQPGLVSLKFVATGLIPAQCVLGLLDSVLHVGPAVVCTNHLPGRMGGVGHDEAHPGEQFVSVPFDFAHHPAALLPGPGSVGKLKDLYLDPGLGRSTHRAGAYLWLHDLFQCVIDGKPDKVCDVFTLSVVINTGLSERRITPEPEQLEKFAVPPDQGLYEIQNSIC